MGTSTGWRKRPFLEKLRKADLYTYNCFCGLVKQGCDPLSLLATISLLERQEAHLLSNWQKDFAGMNAENLRQFAAQIRQIERKVRKFNRTRAAWTMLAALSPQSPLLGLPARLEEYAVMLGGLSRLAGPKKHLARNHFRRILVLDVKKATGRYCDEMVAALIAYAEKNYAYSRRTHIWWRRQHLTP